MRDKFLCSVLIASLMCSMALMPSPAYSQVAKPVARVVSACGTPPYTYTPGQSEQILQDTTGTQCTSSSGGGGGGNVTVVAPLGSQTSAQSVSVVLASDQAALNVSSGVAQGSTTSGQTGALIQCATLTAAPTKTTATTNAVSCDVNQNIRTLDTLAPGSTIQAVPGTANGLSFATITAANSTNATNLKNAAGQLYHLTAYNNSATLAWVSFYNTAGTPTCGTGIVYQAMIPANSTSGAGVVEDIADGLTFSTGIGYCITTGIAGTGSVAASAYVVNFGYK